MASMNIGLIVFLVISFALLTGFRALELEVPWDMRRDTTAKPEWNLSGNFRDVPQDIVPVPCGKDTPCGWAYYGKNSKETIGYMLNRNCFCEDKTFCYRIEDVTMERTYVYRCRAKDPRFTGEYHPIYD